MKISNILIYGFLLTITASTVKSLSPYSVCIAVFFSFLLFSVSLFTHGLGAADIKIISILAYASGFFRTCITGILACLFGLLTFMIIRVVKGKGILKIPFVPCIAAGYITSFLFGEMIV